MLKRMFLCVFICALAACSDASQPDASRDARAATDASHDAHIATDASAVDALDASPAPALDSGAPGPDATTSPDARVATTPDAAVMPSVTSLELGATSACMIRAEQTWCWGAMLGAAPARTSPTPVLVAGLGKTTALSVGSQHACAVDTQTRCWGSSVQAMYPSGIGSRTEIAVNVAEAARAIAAGLNHTCVLDASNLVRCWGEITSGLDSVTQLDSGSTHVCAVNSNNRLFCWGDDGSGQVTGTPSGTVRTATQLSFRNVVSVSAGEARTCALLATKEVTCWGGANPFQPVPMLQNTVQITVGAAISCARSASGAVDCWDGSYGSSPVSVILSGATHVSAGAGRACAAMNDGRVLCWSAGTAPTPLES